MGVQSRIGWEGREPRRRHPDEVARRGGVRQCAAALAVVAAVVVCALAVLSTPAAADRPAPAWTWPLAGPPPVTRNYDPPAVRYGSGHRGVDLGGSAGQAVLAAGGGRISYAGLLAGRGVVVVVHGDLRTTYEPVSAQVGVGQVVQAGSVIGRLEGGHPGCAAAACLHWGLRRGEQYLDPLSLVRAGPVRLLPLPGTLSGSLPGAAGGARSGSSLPAGRADTARPAELPGAEPSSFDLRAAASPTGVLAAAALLAGVALLARPRRPRPDGGAPSAVAPREVADAGSVLQPDSPVATVLDLGQERARRGAAPW